MFDLLGNGTRSRALSDPWSDGLRPLGAARAVALALGSVAVRAFHLSMPALVGVPVGRTHGPAHRGWDTTLGSRDSAQAFGLLQRRRFVVELALHPGDQSEHLVPGHSQAAQRETGQGDAEPFGPDGYTPKAPDAE